MPVLAPPDSPLPAAEAETRAEGAVPPQVHPGCLVEDGGIHHVLDDACLDGNVYELSLAGKLTVVEGNHESHRRFVGAVEVRLGEAYLEGGAVPVSGEVGSNNIRNL